MIFKSRDIQQSFAITFTYMDVPLEDQRVQVTIKQGKDNSSMIGSGDITIDEFKLLLNRFNKLARENKKPEDENSILAKISEVFLNEPYSLKAEVEKYEQVMKKITSEKAKELNINELKANVKKAQTECKNAEERFERDLYMSKESCKMTTLTRDLFLATNELKVKELKLGDKYKITSTKRADMELQKELRLSKEAAKLNQLMIDLEWAKRDLKAREIILEDKYEIRSLKKADNIAKEKLQEAMEDMSKKIVKEMRKAIVASKSPATATKMKR